MHFLIDGSTFNVSDVQLTICHSGCEGGKWAWTLTDIGTNVRQKVQEPTPIIYIIYGQLEKGTPTKYLCSEYKLVHAQNIPLFSTEQMYVAYLTMLGYYLLILRL